MNYSYIFNQQGKGWWSEAYLKLTNGKGVLGQIETLKNQQRMKNMEAKWAT